jgi:UDP-glucuronate 4-epimerase
VHLAAQAGVRYSLTNPDVYATANLVGFQNILECCRHGGVEHLIYASSSSVYGANRTMPYSVSHNVDHPVSLYAATKKANELMAHAYSHLFRLPMTGLRFFTVYGPWGRPDMAMFIFARSIVAGEVVNLFNYGRMRRDFTYIDDIVEAVVRLVPQPAKPGVAGENPMAVCSASMSAQLAAAPRGRPLAHCCQCCRCDKGRWRSRGLVFLPTRWDRVKKVSYEIGGTSPTSSNDMNKPVSV